MDRESIKVAETYRQMSEQHFNGGYFSDAVRAEGERISQLDEKEKHELFSRCFNSAYYLAEHLQGRYEFNKETAVIDLSAEGLGVVVVSLHYFSEEEAKQENTYPNKGIMVRTAFEPTPEREEKYINALGDDLGLETSGPTMVTVDHAPRGWEEHIYANLDGSFPTEDHPYNIDDEILRLLDAQETLNIAWYTLNARVRARAAARNSSAVA